MRLLLVLSMAVSLSCSDKSGGTGSPPTGRTQVEDTAIPSDTGEDTGLISFEVTGVIRDADELPVAGAMVLVGGEEDTMVLTQADGSFSLWYTEVRLGTPAIVAAKIGYRANAFEFFGPDEPIQITIREVKGPDNVNYTYQNPGDGEDSMEENCSHCHTTMVSDFMASAHAEATRNPMLQDLYAGVSRAFVDATSCADAGGSWELGVEPGTETGTMEKCYLGGGVLPDLNVGCGGIGELPCDSPSLAESDRPEAFGACADCHAPGINGVAGGRNLHEAHGLAFDIGVHCDTCHKVRDVDLSQPPGVGQRLIMGRPNEPGTGMFEYIPVFYGPIIDVPNVVMGGSYQPKFDSAVFCAGCHEQEQPALIEGTSLAPRWADGLPVHSTYSEWLEGPYNSDETPCQFCHMPADVGATNAVEITKPEDQSVTFGWARDPSNIRQHLFRGPLMGEPRLVDTALYVSVDVWSAGDSIQTTVSIANVGCGHAVPTGEPMRSVVLLVEAEGECGVLMASGGQTVPDTGGALASATLGEEAVAGDGLLMWPDGAAVAEPGQIIRIVRPTGAFDDYEGIGAFADPSMGAEDKGMEIFAPVGDLTVVAVSELGLELEGDVDWVDGDKLYLGVPWPEAAVDGQRSLPLAGTAGTAFARVLLDGEGNRHVPHYRAIDMASDNRIPPGSNALSSHSFSLPEGCGPVDVRATVLYRPVPMHMAVARGWDAKDYIIATGESRWEP